MIYINKLNSLRLDEIYEKIYLYFIGLSLSIIGPVSYISYLIDAPIIKLWKEFYILIMFLISFYLLIKNKKNNVIKLTIIIISVYFVWILYSISFVDIRQVFYQIKLDLFNIIFIFNTITVFLVSKDRKVYLIKIIKIILIFSIVNSALVIFQGLFSKFYVTKVLGIEWGAWSRKYGISVIISNGKFRSMGLMNSYVSVAELLIIAIILVNEVKDAVKFSNKIKYLLLIIFTVSVYFTTYKTAYLWLVFYFGLKILSWLLLKLNNKNIKKVYDKIRMNYYNANLLILTVILLLFQWVITNTLIFYKLIEKISPKIAYNSIYLRVEFHNSIINQMDTFAKKMMGLGMGLNGSYNGKVKLNGIRPVPLDSSYVYALSNYGFLGLILYISIIMIIMVLSIVYNELDKFGVKYLMSYLLCVQMFFNNLSTSIPISYIVIILILIFIFDIKNEVNIKKFNSLFKI